MADIFISYSSQDRARAQSVARLLEAQGYDVWWDREGLAPGDQYANVIETELDRAKAIVVLWSEASRASYWVRDEAAVGRDRNRLIPVTLDSSQPPLGFRQIQTVAIDALLNDPHTQRLTWSSLAGLCGRPAPEAAADAAPTERPARSTIVPGVNAPTVDKSVKQILSEEKRQRGFLRTFWLTSFVISAIMAVTLGGLSSLTPGYAEGGVIVNGIVAFIFFGVGLVLGRFIIVIGRRLSKRKSVRYFDQPTLIILGLSITFGLVVLFSNTQTLSDRLFTVPLAAAMFFPVLALFSVPIGFAKGLSRKTFEDGH